jgi:hypothetical protein
VLAETTRGEALLTLVVFALVYAGVMLPRVGERLGMLFARWQSRPPRGRGPTDARREP